MRSPLPVTRGDTFELTEFLRASDLTTSGIGEPDVRLWIDVDADSRVVGSTGFEISGRAALLRSVAVSPSHRANGRGTELAQFALDELVALGILRVWLFSRRSGEFWQKLGFESASTEELAVALATTHQVRAFTESGQLRDETAWCRSLGGSRSAT